MRFVDPVAVLRDVVTAATGAPTVRVLQDTLPDGWQLPVVHVALLQTQDLDVERVDTLSVDVYAATPTGPGGVGAAALAALLVDALRARPLVGSAGWADSAEVTAHLGARPYYGVVEVENLTVDVTHRPID